MLERRPVLAIHGLIGSPRPAHRHLILLHAIRIHIVELGILLAGRNPNVWQHGPILQVICWHVRRVKRLPEREVIVRVPKREPVLVQRVDGIVEESSGRPVPVWKWLEQGIAVVPMAVPPTLRIVEVLVILEGRPLAGLVWQTPRQPPGKVLLSIIR